MRNRFAALLVVCACLSTGMLEGQPRGRSASPDLTQPLDDQEAAWVLEQFRNQGLAGDFYFGIRIVDIPRNGERHERGGEIWGRWLAGEARTRLRLDAEAPSGPEKRLLLINGPEAHAYEGGAGTEPPLLEPFYSGSEYTPFDVLAPFIYWTDWRYLGLAYARGRALHEYAFRPDAADGRYASVGSVVVSLDAEFNALLRVRTYDREGQLLKTLEVGSFRRVDGQWLARQVRVFNEQSRHESRLEITEVALNLSLPEPTFWPDNLGQEPEVPAAEVRRRL